MQSLVDQKETLSNYIINYIDDILTMNPWAKIDKKEMLQLVKKELLSNQRLKSVNSPVAKRKVLDIFNCLVEKNLKRTKDPNILYSYAINLLKVPNTYNGALREVQKLKDLFNRINYYPDPDWYLKIADTVIMSEILSVIIQKDVDSLSVIPADRIYDDIIISNLISSYCLQNNLLLPDIDFDKSILNNIQLDSALHYNDTKASPKEVWALCEEVHKGNEEAKNTLFDKSLYLVLILSCVYKDRRIELQDLMQEGSIGLMNAIGKYHYDYERLPFENYATLWIRHYIGNAILEKDCVTNKEESYSDSSQKDDNLDEVLSLLESAKLTDKEKQTLIRRLGLDGKAVETQSQIARRCNVSRQSVESIEKRALKKLKDAKLAETSKTDGKTIQMPQGLNTVYEFFYQYDKKTIDKAISQLTPEQKQIFTARFGEDLTERMPRGSMTEEERQAFYGGCFRTLKRKMERIKNGPPKRKGHPRAPYNLETIYEYFAPHSKKTIDKAIAKLDEGDQQLLSLRFGEDFEKPVKKSLVPEEKINYFYHHLLGDKGKMRRILYDMTQDDYVDYEEIEEYEAGIIKECYDSARELLQEEIPSQLKHLSDIERYLAMMKLGYIENQRFSNNTLIKFFGVTEEQIVEATRKALNPPKDDYEAFLDRILEEAFKESNPDFASGVQKVKKTSEN